MGGKKSGNVDGETGRLILRPSSVWGMILGDNNGIEIDPLPVPAVCLSFSQV